MATPATGISGKLSDVCGMDAVVLAGAGVALLVVVLFVVLLVVLFVVLLVVLFVVLSDGAAVGAGVAVGSAVGTGDGWSLAVQLTANGDSSVTWTTSLPFCRVGVSSST